MSLEEIVSVVGSEVMPLAYGGMDSESSPSSSEKTVEGVRGDEVVGVGGDNVPITVVEVEGRRERGYDVDAEIVEEVKQYRFELGTRDSLGHLVENYEIFSQVLVRPAGVEERTCSAPRDHWMPMYAHYLVAGLRFPIPKLLVDDTEWERGDTEVKELSSWKAKRANHNKFSLNEDEEEEVGKLVRKGEDVLNIMDLTSVECIGAVELYGPSALSEGVAIPKKPRKKSKTSTKEERGALQKKKKVEEEEEGRGSEVPQFVPRLPLVELDPELRESEEGAEVRAPGKGKGLVPPLSFQSRLFEAKNMTRARRFINATFPECDQLQKEKEELEKKNKQMQEVLDEVVPVVKQLEQERSSLSTKLVFEESKRRISESEREAQAKEKTLMKDAFVELKENVQMLVHNGMKEHINNFISSSSFDDIVNLYWLPTAIIAFTDYRKKVKVEYPEVDITKITFGEQEEGGEENGESMSVDFRPQIKLRWDHDADRRAVFPPKFDFEFVAVEEEGAEVEEDEVEARVEGAEVDESQPIPKVEIHPVPSNDEQPPLPDEQQPTQSPLPTEQEPVEPPPPAEK
ncbi:hypothetical protein SLEP1_g18938 [Rubroshorea leprosula]|uniref:Uncharacterized protein n=1 Tax=Rubroshorea leprosula TaxID=152421 RepID=A0AAV5J515_9ROSI|nr:hypothetical protein SLEP1_g18938 [Rubroshorea leprosula]